MIVREEIERKKEATPSSVPFIENFLVVAMFQKEKPKEDEEPEARWLWKEAAPKRSSKD
jgi:hypothetical protein